MDLKKVAQEYLFTFVGTNYKWGGDDPVEGMDCSGLALEFLNAFLYNIPDTTAEGLRQLFKQRKVTTAKFGTLVFFGSSNATHVGIALDDTLMIEAGGGGSKVTDRATAAKANAFIKVRPILRRKDLIELCHPEYKWD